MAVNLKIVSQVVASGTPGPAGKSAYQIAVDNGFQGTESEWLKELHPFKGWFDSVSDLETSHANPIVGDYAYVKGATSSDPVKIYKCSTEGTWSDSGRTVDTSSVQTFGSGEAVNDVDITDDSSEIVEDGEKIPTAGAIAGALGNAEFSTGEKVKNVGIDNEPTAGSDNLVKSGGVQNELALGAVYDVSAKNPTAGPNNDGKFESLSALFSDANLNTLVPIAVRKGGMSIKFVCSSDNKYVQYRLMADEWSIDTEDWSIADEGVYIENSEFVYVKTDNEGKILWAIKTDGGIYYGAGCPQQVKDYIEEKISSLSLDEYEDIVAFLSDYLGSDTTLKVMIDGINAQIARKLNAEGLDADALGTIQAVENNEYIQVTTDSENKILEGITRKGAKQINLPINTPSATIEHIENSEYVNVIIDSDEKVLLGIKANGAVYIPLLEGRKEIQTKIEQLESWSDKRPPLLQRKNVPAISWIDDDFLITQETASYNILRTWCNAHNIHLDFAAIPSVEYTDETQTDIRRIYFNEAYLQAIRDYENEGFQFVVHPVHHGLYGEELLGEGYIRKNLLLCQKAFRENIIGNSDIFVYAGASSGTPGMLKVVKELYDCAFTPDVNRPIIGVERDRYHLGRCGIEISAQHTVSQIKAEIDDAISRGAWIVLLTHIYNYTGDGTEPTDETSMSMSNLFEIITYANSKVPIVPTSEIWRERKIMWEYYQ